MRASLIVLYVVIFSFTISCNEHDGVTLQPVKDNSGVTLSKVAEITASQMKAAAGANGFGDLSPKIKYDITISKIIYKTKYKGNDVYASGLVFMPKTDTVAFSLLCFNHGTLFLKSDAPSLNPIGSGLELVSATGFIVVMPDYLGYGESSDLFHPYYDQAHSASVVVDIIKAGRSSEVNKNAKVNNKVFIVGYSEGGYVTMAASKQIVRNPDPYWKLSGIAAGAGGYNLNGFLNYLSVANYYDNPAYLAFIIKSYNKTYNWDASMDDYFSSQYADVVDTYLNGSYGGAFINGKLTPKLDSLFNHDFYSGLKEMKESNFSSALKLNTLLDWKCDVPTRMYHGTHDSAVYFSDSETTYKSLLSNGYKNLKFIPIEGGTHSTSLKPMIIDVLPWLEQLNNEK